MNLSQHLIEPDHLGRFKSTLEARDTEDLYSVADSTGRRRYSAQRRSLHIDLLKRHVDGFPVSSEPVAVFTGGGPCSGKGAVARELGKRLHKDITVLDADIFKEALPEYQQMLSEGNTNAANYTHEESSFLAKLAVMRAISKRRSFVYDSTFSNPTFLTQTIKALRVEGYHVVIGFADRPPEIAFEAELERAMETGRKIDKTLLFEKNHKAVSTLSQLHHLVDEVHVFSTAEPPPAPFLTLVFSKLAGSIHIHRPDLFMNLQKRGHNIVQPGAAGR